MKNTLLNNVVEEMSKGNHEVASDVLIRRESKLILKHLVLQEFITVTK